MPVREGERPQQCTIYTWINVMDIFYYALLSVDEFKMFLFVFINGDLLILKYILHKISEVSKLTVSFSF